MLQVHKSSWQSQFLVHMPSPPLFFTLPFREIQIMKIFRSAPIYLTFAALALTAGCSAKVESTDDSVKLEAELPKVEVGEKAPDLDPRTDDDVDIDTPAPGDS